MSKWTFDYETGEYGEIDRDGFNWTRGEYTYNWDDSDYRREDEQRHGFGGFRGLFDDDDDD